VSILVFDQKTFHALNREPPEKFKGEGPKKFFAADFFKSFERAEVGRLLCVGLLQSPAPDDRLQAGLHMVCFVVDVYVNRATGAAFRTSKY
jgi:hypothetical protein